MAAKTSKLHLLISVVLCSFPGFTFLLPQDLSNIAWHLCLTWKVLDHMNKKVNNKPLQFPMSIILPGNPTRIWHKINCSDTYRKHPVKDKGTLFQEIAKSLTRHFGLQLWDLVSKFCLNPALGKELFSWCNPKNLQRVICNHKCCML